MNKQYEELKEALVGDTDNWTHEELVEQALKLYDKAATLDTALHYIKQPDIDDDSYTLSKVKDILRGD